MLASVILKHLEKYRDDSHFVQTFLRDLYVDDSISGSDSPKEALDLYIKSKYRLLEAGLLLRKWHSSDPVVEERILAYENEARTENYNSPSSTGKDGKMNIYSNYETRIFKTQVTPLSKLVK